MSKINVGLIGLGWMGHWHGRNLLANENVKLVSVSDTSDNRVDSFFEENKYECQAYQDYKLLLNTNIDAVVIASPNLMHAEMCIEAAKKGKHIFCEKPMALTTPVFINCQIDTLKIIKIIINSFFYTF